MSRKDRVLSALNFLTGEGVNYYPDGCDGRAIEALISDYFHDGPSDDESDDECDHKNEGSLHCANIVNLNNITDEQVFSGYSKGMLKLQTQKINSLCRSNALTMQQ